MITFRTLGSTELKGSQGRDVQSVLARPKLLGLLAYLAVARPRGFHRRDSLLPLLWEDLDEDRARRALRQSLYHLRRALGEEAIVARGDEEVGVNEAIVWCDARAFEDALQQEAPDEAMSLYRGELLSGFNVVGSAGFERWLDSRRQELGRVAKEAALQLAERAEMAGDYSAVADWARRAVSLDPFDELLVRQVISMLDRTGNRSGAIREYEAFAERLVDELHLDPSPETCALADEVRARSTPAALTERVEGEPKDIRYSEVPPAAQPARRPPWLRYLLASATAIALALTTVLVWHGRGDIRDPTVTEDGAPNPRSIAVLPFENFSGEVETEPFVSGIHEDILVLLYKIAGLKPISRTSVMEYDDTKKNLREIADELGVAAILEGGVQRIGNRVRVTVQLINAETDEHIWAEEYERDLTAENVFSIQGDIARQIAAALRVRLSEEEAAQLAYQPTRSLEAYDVYLTARDYQRRWRASEEDRRIVVEQYRKAIELEPDFALAHAELAGFQSTVCYIYGCPKEVMEATRDHAERALALEPFLAPARVALGNYHYYALSDYDRAEEEYLRAIELEPNNADAHGRLAAVRARTGRFEEAMRSAAKAAELSPRDPDAHDLLGYLRAWLRDYEGAIDSFDRSIALAPDVYFPRLWKTWAIINLEGNSERGRDTWMSGVEALDRQMLPLSTIFWGRALIRVLGPQLPVQRFPGDLPIPEASYLLSRATREEAFGNVDAASIWYDSARVFLEQHAEEMRPEYATSALAVAHARLGNEFEAIQEAKLATELVTVSDDALEAPWFVATLAEVYVIAGNYEAALDQLEILLAVPCPVSPPLLEADPLWNPLRNRPRYRALMERPR